MVCGGTYMCQTPIIRGQPVLSFKGGLAFRVHPHSPWQPMTPITEGSVETNWDWTEPIFKAFANLPPKARICIGKQIMMMLGEYVDDKNEDDDESNDEAVIPYRVFQSAPGLSSSILVNCPAHPPCSISQYLIVFIIPIFQKVQNCLVQNPH